MARLAGEMWMELLKYNIAPWWQYVPSKLNIADVWSRPDKVREETVVPATSSGAVGGSSSSFPFPSPVTSGPSGSSVGRSAFPVIQWAPYTARESEGVQSPLYSGVSLK